MQEQAGLTGGQEWRLYGGHRLWHAPEGQPRTYSPDNDPVDWGMEGEWLHLTQPTEPTTGIQKEMKIRVVQGFNYVNVLHRLTNRGLWDVELAPWALTVMAPGGTAYIKQEPYAPHPEALLPARPLVLWPYTNMADKRFTWGRTEIQMRMDPSIPAPLKFGVCARNPYATYVVGGTSFTKSFKWADGAFPDFGCNMEFFTNHRILELESLGPLTKLSANGGFVEHMETWAVWRQSLPEDEAERSLALDGMYRQIDEHVAGQPKSR
jgi:hypothetical protein